MGSSYLSVDSSFNNFSDKATLTITATTNYALTASGNNDSAMFDISTTGVLTLSGEYGAKMSFDVAAKTGNNDDVSVQGSAVVISGNDTYQCAFTADTNNDIVSAAHCTKN